MKSMQKNSDYEKMYKLKQTLREIWKIFESYLKIKYKSKLNIPERNY